MQVVCVFDVFEFLNSSAFRRYFHTEKYSNNNNKTNNDNNNNNNNIFIFDVSALFTRMVSKKKKS